MAQQSKNETGGTRRWTPLLAAPALAALLVLVWVGTVHAQDPGISLVNETAKSTERSRGRLRRVSPPHPGLGYGSRCRVTYSRDANR